MILSLVPLHAQNSVKGIVRDITTNMPIEMVTVSTGDAQFSTLTNRSGNFQLKFNSGVTNIVFSHLSYAKYQVNLTDLPADGVFYLNPKTFELEEVVIINTPINLFLEKLIASSRAQLTTPLVQNTYYREFLTFNGRYVEFSDGLVDFSLYRKGKDIENKVAVNQSRAVFLEEYKQGSLKVINPVIENYMPEICNFTYLKGIFLTKKRYKSYNFTFKNFTSPEGTPLTKIEFNPTEGVKDDLWEGTIIYDPEKYIIMDIDIKKVPALLQYAKVHNRLIFGKYQYGGYTLKTSYKNVAEKYMLSYFRWHREVRTWKPNAFDNHYSCKNDIIVTSSTTDGSEFDENEPYRKKTLYETPTNYKDKFWEGNNAILLTEEEQQIIKLLDTKTINPQTNKLE